MRRVTEELCRPLETEDFVVQSMPDASPAKWHLAHTSWFFETFILGRASRKYRAYDPQFSYLFNSYYLSIGERHCRPKRGLLSRPTVAEVYKYRRYVDEHMLASLESPNWGGDLDALVEVGLNHEQQHQELLLTDLKHLFASNPLRPAYQPDASRGSSSTPPPMRWVSFPEGLVTVGHAGPGFAYDNESPAHRVFLNSFALGSRLVTNGEYRAFIDDGGYRRGEFWLSDGWNTVRTGAWEAPLYWEQRDGQWWMMTLAGMRPVDDAEPVCHVSYYEADAFSRWAGARLAGEEEWERVAADVPVAGNLLDTGALHPIPSSSNTADGPQQLFGDVWEWTRSAYLAYPGYQPPAGALGEYNGKFMCNQFVLRGGSCATPASHIRATYRNFFPPDARWQFSGIRLARDA